MINSIYCPIGARKCRHASFNYVISVTEKTKIRQSILGPERIPDGHIVEVRPNEKGVFCNDGGQYVGCMENCPIMQGTHHHERNSGIVEPEHKPHATKQDILVL